MLIFLLMLASTGLMYYYFMKSQALEAELAVWRSGKKPAAGKRATEWTESAGEGRSVGGYVSAIKNRVLGIYEPAAGEKQAGEKPAGEKQKKDSVTALAQAETSKIGVEARGTAQAVAAAADKFAGRDRDEKSASRDSTEAAPEPKRLASANSDSEPPAARASHSTSAADEMEASFEQDRRHESASSGGATSPRENRTPRATFTINTRNIAPSLPGSPVRAVKFTIAGGSDSSENTMRRRSSEPDE